MCSFSVFFCFLAMKFVAAKISTSLPEVFANLTISLPSAAWQGYSEIGISHFYKRFIWTTILSVITGSPCHLVIPKNLWQNTRP